MTAAPRPRGQHQQAGRHQAGPAKNGRVAKSGRSRSRGAERLNLMMINDTAAEKKRRLVCGAQLSSQKSSPLPTAPASHSSGACRSLSKGARTCRAAHAPRGKAVRLHAPGPSQGAPLYPWAFYRSVWRRPRPCAPGRAECRGFALSGAPPTPWRTRGTARATAAAAACRVGRCAQGAHLAALPHPRCARAVLCLLSPPPPPRVPQTAPQDGGAPPLLS